MISTLTPEQARLVESLKKLGQAQGLAEAANEPSKKTDIVWRALARQVIIADGAATTLASYLDALLTMNFERMLEVLEGAIAELESSGEVLR